MNGIKIYSKSKTGKTLEWKAETDYTLDANGWITLNIYYGQEGGKIQHKVRHTKSGKNKGKANATTIQEQAELDLSYLYRAQLEEKGYCKDINLYEKPKTAMLAHKFADKKHKLNLDKEDNFLHHYFVQPKLNGIRCTATKVSDTEIKYISRTNKEFTPFIHLTPKLLSILEVGDTVDGELFNPLMPLEYIASLVNSETERYVVDKATGTTLWNVSDLQYHLYDGVKKGTDYTYSQRMVWLSDVLTLDETVSPLILVLTKQVKSLEEVRSYFSEWIALGYEGLMLRDGESIYEFNERSIGLLKYKEMIDEEFQIVDIIDSDNEPGSPKFIVDVRNGQFCEVRKKGSKTDNLIYLTDKEKYIGKWLTVQYQARTKYDNLSFPVGLLLRDGVFTDGEFVPSV